MLVNDGELLFNDGEMLVNDGEMSIWSYTHFTIIDWHFTILDWHFTIINEHFTTISLKCTIIEKLHWIINSRIRYFIHPCQSNKCPTWGCCSRCWCPRAGESCRRSSSPASGCRGCNSPNKNSIWTSNIKIRVICLYNIYT